MEHLRYPIGRFQPVGQPSPEHRNGWIDDISAFPGKLRAVVQNMTSQQLLTPYRPGGWTVQQVVHHIADNDMNAYLRFKRALTEDNPTASSYREDLWAELSDYQEVPIETSLVLIESLHIRFTALLKSLHPTDFQREFISPSHGRMTLDMAAQRYGWHGLHHSAQIESLKERMGW